MEPQSLDARYVDLQKLIRLLINTFGAGNFKIDTRDGGDRIVLSVPRKLTEKEQEDVQM